jgi:dGTP triphosphohydrolase
MKFLETIENINEAKLNSAVKLFKQMAKFSESINGNFKDLADALNVKLMPLMEELKELLEGVQDKVEQTGANISASTYAASQGNLTEEQHAQQINRENPTASPEEQNKLLQKRLFEQSQQNSQLIAKIDELIDLFRYGQAKVSFE